MRQPIQWAALRQEETADPFPPLPNHVALAVYDGSAASSPPGYRWNQICVSCQRAAVVPTTANFKDSRQCRFCRVSTVVLRRFHWARKHQAWAEADQCYDLFRCLHQHREAWFRWTEREQTRYRAGLLMKRREKPWQ